jgi:hypothetical protein
MRQDHVGCYGIRNNKYVIRQQCFERYCAVRCDLFVFVRCNLNLGSFLFATCITPKDAPSEALYYFVFLQWSHAEQDNNAISEDHHKWTPFDTKG